jgi:hypothetical protein
MPPPRPGGVLPLPDHSSMTRIRERYGITIFRQFFEAIVEWCRDDGLI